jgi:hypothetical protein
VRARGDRLAQTGAEGRAATAAQRWTGMILWTGVCSLCWKEISRHCFHKKHAGQSVASRTLSKS